MTRRVSSISGFCPAMFPVLCWVAGQRWRIEVARFSSPHSNSVWEITKLALDGLASPHHFGLSRGFLVSALRYQAEPLGNSQSSISSSGLVIWLCSKRPIGLSSGWILCRNLSSMDLEVNTLFPALGMHEFILHWSFGADLHLALARYHHYRKRSQVSLEIFPRL